VSAHWTDREILEVLDAFERQGVSSPVIARKMGVTPKAILNLRDRINSEADKVECKATRAENRDGGMPPRWWA
jgi:hypothetical protein